MKDLDTPSSHPPSFYSSPQVEGRGKPAGSNGPRLRALEEEEEERARFPSISPSFTTVGSDEILAAVSEVEDSNESGHDNNSTTIDSVEGDDREPLIKEQEVSYAPDGGYGWVIVLGAFLSNLVLDGISVSQSALMEGIRRDSGVVRNGSCPPSPFSNCSSTEPVYEISVGMYGLISSVLVCLTLVAGPFVSLMIDAFGFRRVGVMGSVLASAGIFISWATSETKPNIWLMTTFFGGMAGLGFGMMFQPGIVLVGIYFEKWRPLATGLAMMGTGAGTVIFPPVLSFISQKWSWREAYLFQGAITLLAAIFPLLYFPLPTKKVRVLNVPRKSKETSASAGAEREEKTQNQESGLSSMADSMLPLLKSPTFLLLSFSGLITMLGFFGPYAFLVDRAMKELNVDSKSATFLLSIIGISNTSGRFIFGLISCHPSINPFILSNTALSLAGLATLLIPYTTAYYQLIIYTIIFGIGIAIFTVLRSILVLKLMGLERFNNAYGLSLLFMGVGTLIGNPLGGWLKDRSGKYEMSFYAAGGYLLLSAILTYPIQRLRDWETKGAPAPAIPRPPRHFQRSRTYSLSLSLHI